MAALTGDTGLVTWTGANYDTNVFDWTADIEQGEHDVTVFASTPPTWRTWTPGKIRTFTGTFQAYMDDTTIQTAPDAPETLETVTMRLKGAVTISGTGFVRRLGLKVNIDDKQTVTYEFRGSGTLSFNS